MGTAKRERQKANRQLRLQELAKEARKEKSKRVLLRSVLAIGAVVALVGIVYLVNRDDGSSVNGETTTTLALDTSTTVDPNLPTTTVPPKPEVSLPATIPTSLVTTVITEGTGEPAKVGDTVSVHYIGVTSADGTEFDNSYDRGSPITVTLGTGSVIQGWDQGLVGVKVGERLQLDIPADLAYGATGNGSIGPDTALSFVIDVMSITPAG